MRPAADRRPLLHAALLALLGLLLFLPSFAAEELDDEEARRAVPAREMIASGDFVLPTFFGETYLAKPPLYFWMVAAASVLTGGVDEAATRLPSVLSTIATALLVALVARRTGGVHAGLAAGLVFLCTLTVFEKGAFGELEAAFALFTFAASAAWIADRRLWAALALAAALLVKGPPALVFFGATVAAHALARRDTRLLGPARLGLPLLGGCALAGVWVALVWTRTGADAALDRWGGEMARGGGLDLPGALRERVRFLLGVAAGFLPGSAVWLASLRTTTRTRLSRDAAYRAAEWTLALGLLFFLLMPGTRTRYAYPLAPWVALVAGRLLAELAPAPGPFGRRVGGILRAVAILGVGVVAASGWLAVGSIGDLHGVGAAGAALALLLLAVSVAAWRAARPRAIGRRALALGFAVLALARGIQLFDVVPRTAGHRGRQVAAREIERGLPPGARLHYWTARVNNELFYVRNPVVRAADPLLVEPGEYLLVEVPELERLRAEGLRGRELTRLTAHDGPELALLEVE